MWQASSDAQIRGIGRALEEDEMELILLALAFIGIDALALRRGADSRDKNDRGNAFTPRAA
jgi:hypothetical protein